MIHQAQELLKLIEKAIDDAPVGEINGETYNTDALEDARDGLIDVIASLQSHERVRGVNTDFAEHNVWNFAQTGVKQTW